MIIYSWQCFIFVQWNHHTTPNFQTLSSPETLQVSSLIFVTNTFFLAVGYIYYVFIKNFRKGDLLYIVIFVLLTGLSIFEAYHIHRSENELVNLQFHELLGGLFLINGVVAFVGIPLMFHSKKFKDAVI